MISIEEINRYPELNSFISANNDAEREQCAKQLCRIYTVMNNILLYSENLSPMGIVAGLGLLEHFIILEKVYHPLSREDAAGSLMKAATGGHLNILNHLLEHYLATLTGSYMYSAMLMAIRVENISFLNRLLEIPVFEQMFLQNSPVMFINAYKTLNTTIVKRILTYPKCLEFADNNGNKYTQTPLLEFILEKITHTRTLKMNQTDEDELHVFDVALNEGVLCFYMLRNLIRRNSPTLQTSIQFLLNIPSVRKLAHTEVTPGKSNELFRLALDVNNYSAEKQLCLIPSVRESAEKNDFYGNEAAFERHKNRRMQFEASLSCITMLQAIYPAPRAMPRQFENSHAEHMYAMFYKTFITEILGIVFSYLKPLPQADHLSEDLRFVFKSKAVLLAQDSRLFHRLIETPEPEDEHVNSIQASDFFFIKRISSPEMNLVLPIPKSF